MSKSNNFENAVLKLFFNATAISDLAENDTTSPATSLYVSLHTADPGEAGDQETNEIAYTGYARVAVARTTGGWSVSGNAVSPVANIDFAEMTGGAGGTVTHFGVGAASSGSGRLLYKGALTPNLTVVTGVTPHIASTTTITED